LEKCQLDAGMDYDPIYKKVDPQGFALENSVKTHGVGPCVAILLRANSKNDNETKLVGAVHLSVDKLQSVLDCKRKVEEMMSEADKVSANLENNFFVVGGQQIEEAYGDIYATVKGYLGLRFAFDILDIKPAVWRVPYHYDADSGINALINPEETVVEEWSRKK
jgi:hypothetical protein